MIPCVGAGPTFATLRSALQWRATVEILTETVGCLPRTGHLTVSYLPRFRRYQAIYSYVHYPHISNFMGSKDAFA